MKRLRYELPAPLASSAVQIRRRPTRIVSYQSGSVWRLNDARVTVVTHVSTSLVRVKRSADDHIDTVPIANLLPWSDVDDTERLREGDTLRDVYTPEVLSRAHLEYSMVAALVNSGDLSRLAKARTANSLGISARHLRTKLQRYFELGTPEAFLPKRSGPPRGAVTVNPRVERLITEVIGRELALSADIACADIFPIIEADALALGLKPPGTATVSRRLRRERRKVKNLPSEIGNELAYRNAPVPGALSASSPLSVVEMDHTTCDVHIVHPELRCPIGRPVLSMMIDWKTRVILGMCLSLEAPSRLTVGLCMHHGIFPKQAWLTSLGIPDACWPGFGLPNSLQTDNASEFDSQSQRRAAQRYGIELKFRPPGHPAAGGIIERVIGTMMGKVRLIPGQTYSKALGDRPRHPESRARFALRELELYLAREISMYHKRTHEGIGMPPLTAWEKAWTVNGCPCIPTIPDCADTFRITFLPGTWRTITREGIELHALRYQSASLYPLIERQKKLMVRWDPRDLSCVFVETPDLYIRVPWVETGLAPISSWEWRELRAQRIEFGRSRDRPRIAAEARANRELVAAKARDTGQWRAARRLARQAEWERSRAVVPSVKRTVQSRANSDGKLTCRVED